MDRETELGLIDELLGLSDAGSAYLDDAVTRSEVAHYTDADHFDRETRAVFRGTPALACHRSELAGPGDFLRLDLAGLPVLLTRDGDGVVHAFVNVCRHRGARLVEDAAGCRHSFTCPYHGWTWSNSGALRGIPHQAQGFPGIDKTQYGLVRLPCAELHGWIWVVPDPQATADIAGFLRPLENDLRWLDMEDMHVAQTDVIDCAANWKLLIEGGIEAYHFRVAHAQTIGPYFPDNLSTYQMFGPHMRTVLPRITMTDLTAQSRDGWDIRTHANLVYTLFATSQLLVQKDHVVWIRMVPVSPGHTRVHLSTVAPGSAQDGRADHWARNHRITLATLREDFEIGAAVQGGLASGANTHLTFGRFEGALHAFNETVRAALGDK